MIDLASYLLGDIFNIWGGGAVYTAKGLESRDAGRGFPTRNHELRSRTSECAANGPQKIAIIRATVNIRFTPADRKGGYRGAFASLV